MTTYVQNKRAHLNFELLKSFETGVVLFGYEVKAIRANQAKLEGSHVIIRGDEAFLVGANISAYQPANTPKNYDGQRARKLLLSKKEIKELERASENAGLTLVPLKWYNKGSKIKLAIAIARGKKKADKRESLKKRDTKREIERTLKGQF
ncbi:SsrA-binding protein SmpB [Candidatus Kaiserbacteria bacterium]|nr:SsrA-binding protein SmpB [Candidatus Kaiserbacteria bacterium]